MLLCTPTSNANGLNSTIHGHFGSAPFFTLFNTETEEVQILENNNSHHSHGTCHPMIQLAHYKIDAVLCSGMGRRAVEALNSEGIKTVISEATVVKDAIKNYKDGKAIDINPNKSCRGHGQNQPENNQKIVMENDQQHQMKRKTGNQQGSGRGSGGFGNGKGRNR